MEYFPKMCDVREANEHIEGDSPRHDVTDTLMSEAHAFTFKIILIVVHGTC
jgi:hypothetical protein